MTGWRRIRGERGATLAEAAIVLPIVFLLVFGIIEWGMFFRDQLTMSNVTRNGARAGAAGGADGYADYYLLRAMRRTSTALPNETIERVVVFKASGPDGEPTDDCKNGVPVPGVCNVYQPGDMYLAKPDFALLTRSNDWPGSSREDSAQAGPDYVGVWAVTHHKTITGLIPFLDRDVSTTTVMRIEPRRN